MTTRKLAFRLKAWLRDRDRVPPERHWEAWCRRGWIGPGECFARLGCEMEDGGWRKW